MRSGIRARPQGRDIEGLCTCFPSNLQGCILCKCYRCPDSPWCPNLALLLLHCFPPDMRVIPLTGGRMPCVSGVPGEEKKKKVENHDCNYREKKHGELQG